MTHLDDPALASALAEYAQRWPDERATVGLFEELRGDAANPYVRERLAGHFTASCWLVDRSGERTLLTHHRKLGMWLQLGGHADGERDLQVVALKEAEEESGLRGLSIAAGIFDLDRHWIPAASTGALGDQAGGACLTTFAPAKSPCSRQRTGTTTCAMSCTPAKTRPTRSARNRMTWHGARSRTSRSRRAPTHRCSGWRASGWRDRSVRRGRPRACPPQGDHRGSPQRQYSTRVRSVPGIAASAARSSVAWASSALTSITT